MQIHAEWNRDDNQMLKGVIKLLKEVQDIETCNIALELLIKQIPETGSKIKLVISSKVYLCENEDFCKILITLLHRFSSTQVIAPALQLISIIMDIQYKPNLVRVI